ncbi:recombinase family protein [Nocardia sp. R16R-3T]
MARQPWHITEFAAQLDERGIDLIVRQQGIDSTTTPAGRFSFHVTAAMDEMTADPISEGTTETTDSPPRGQLDHDRPRHDRSRGQARRRWRGDGRGSQLVVS